ncbi:cytochrome P450 [Novosphingobium cyanobacteriorum]|uniref:Cytochrome P450 n=1 Tax=Novosphingobium cyanobacteriorum TaxID=3024215 RepID=A0ABT6CNX5_9SPHN|nr:cytochrome P450 [Novosphingobium cyanobacteriorum]MDF8335288.1 cytochrome P450 [Novosphingobium cyanobacteriorum]
MGGTSFATVGKPEHVPTDRVVDFDYMHPAGLENGTVYDVLRELQNGPDIVWTPRYGGHWIVTRFEDVKWVQDNFAIFSHEEFTIPREASPIKMPPLTVDPPLHARYRAVLNPFFTPRKVAEMGEQARALTNELIDKVIATGRCDFRKDFAEVMPPAMFLGIVDLPAEKREQFVEWGKAFMHADNAEARMAALGPIVGYLNGVMAERYAGDGDDMLTAITRWRDNPRFGGEHEVIGMALLVYFGGLDTVANLLSFVAWHLAEHPGHQRRLRDDPDIIPAAAEEYFRRFGLSNTGRLILSDVERDGVTMKAGEMVMVPIGASSIDERRYPDPLTVDFDRPGNFAPGGGSHNTFGNGPHKCLGQPLARAELKVFLEEWMRRVPEFRIDPARPPVSHMGSVNGVSQLHLLWDV